MPVIVVVQQVAHEELSWEISALQPGNVQLCFNILQSGAGAYTKGRGS